VYEHLTAHNGSQSLAQSFEQSYSTAKALRIVMEIIESIVWFSAGLLPTLAALEAAWKVGDPSKLKVPMAAGGGKTGYA
jgi:hypothetical protein